VLADINDRLINCIYTTMAKENNEKKYGPTDENCYRRVKIDTARHLQ
jgi:hypothetical protein